MELTQDIARRFAQAALGHVAREYPNKLDHVMAGDADAQAPRQLHPCFFGSYDWHSCVHGWWTLLTLRRLYPDMPEAAAIAELADETFTAGKLAIELAYAQRPESKGFERPYGWGWYLYLHLEASRHDAPWASRMEPLARHFAAMLKSYLDVLTYPITVGTHFNTPFALVLARDWAKANDPSLVETIDQWSMRCFEDRTDYRGWEPGGDEFLSPALMAAQLMSRVAPVESFVRWFDGFLPADSWLSTLEPAHVSDRSDGKIAHLDGLNLSRACCLRGIANRLIDHPRSASLERLAQIHLDAALPHVTGDYMGEHWLASFALLALLAAPETDR
ncbi:DUF2891 domain-containing protein [Erythrobacter litoralis]|uniref:DUF2891 domain-containing protein n=1 Tax=Erythrobacter litoralis (strain HTCC2594) TaxID=314225 RepID=Q2N8Q0_ERYLH|nr:DUF2891 domain-containing protein [Erythrobacter litoralis]ABC63941.1 hypothetical protein ELI_09245 [Erythrobacter litoralis HTCC2594]